MFVAMRYGIARGIYANEAGLRHRGRRLRHGAERAAGAAGPERDHRSVHRVVRHVDDQRDDDPADRRLAVAA